MKIFIVDESKATDFFVYGGVIVDVDALPTLRQDLYDKIKASVGKEIPDGFELKRSQRDCNQQISAELTYLTESKDTTTLNYIANFPNLVGNTTVEYFSEQEVRDMHAACIETADSYDGKISYVALVFPAISPDAKHGDARSRYMVGLKYCTDTFEKYLQKHDTQGIMLVDRFGAEAGKFDPVSKNILRWQARYRFRRIILFLPQMIVEEIFSLTNVFLGLVNECFRVGQASIDGKTKEQVDLLKKRIYRINVYPNTFAIKHANQLNLFK